MADLVVSSAVDTFMQATTQGQMVAALSNGGTALTAGRVAFVGTGGVLQDSSALTFDGTSLFFGATTPGSITGSSGSLTFAASGTNQNITLTPSGAGQVVGNFAKSGVFVQFNNVSANGGIQLSRTTTGAGNSFWQVSTNGGGQLTWDSDFSVGHTGAVGVIQSIASGAVAPTIYLKNGHLLLGGLTTDGTGVLQFPAATTSAGGIGFGTDTNLYRSAQGRLQTDGTFAGGEIGFMSQNSATNGYATFRFANTGAGGKTFSFGSAGSGASPVIVQSKFYIYDNTDAKAIAAASNAAGWVFYTNGENAALTLDSSQNATFAGTARTSLALGASLVYGNTNDTDSGITFPGADQIGFNVGGAQSVRVDTTQFLVNGTRTVTFGQTALAKIGVSADTTAGNLVLTTTSTGEVVIAGTGIITKPGGTVPQWKTNTAITSGAGASTGTLLNAPAAGNPTCWVPINDNGTTRYVPAW